MTDTMTANQPAFSGDTTAKKGIPGSTLKLIAIIAMFIDHTGAVILERLLISKGIMALDGASVENSLEFIKNNGVLFFTYLIFRLIGRLGFPIFCFLLIEGFIHTRNVWKYAFRLLLFAFISEVPFDLAFKGFVFYADYQNVFFTLFLGLCALICIKFIEDKVTVNNWLKYLLIIPVTIVFMIIANLLMTDYAGTGVLTIVIMYILRKNRVLEMAAGCIVLTIMSFMEVTALFNMIPVAKYNGERGLNLKYVFYAFYPVHLLVLYLIAYLMGIV